jgi:branched-subunit amino acid transport protein
VFPELFLRSGGFDVSLDNHRLLAGLFAVIVAWVSRNTLLTILAGMVALFVTQLVLR